jgi:hypothetical protein
VLAAQADTIPHIQTRLYSVKAQIAQLEANRNDSDDWQCDYEDACDAEVILSVALKAAFILRVCGFVNDTQSAAFRSSLAR